MRASIVMVAMIAALGLCACSTMRQTEPARTATEQLEIAAAVDRVAEQLTLQIPPGTKVFLDTSDFEGYDGKYAIGAIKDHLPRSGARLVADRGGADMAVEAGAGFD